MKNALLNFFFFTFIQLFNLNQVTSWSRNGNWKNCKIWKWADPLPVRTLVANLAACWLSVLPCCFEWPAVVCKTCKLYPNHWEPIRICSRSLEFGVMTHVTIIIGLLCASRIVRTHWLCSQAEACTKKSHLWRTWQIMCQVCMRKRHRG